jgi:hypothetical protein
MTDGDVNINGMTLRTNDGGSNGNVGIGTISPGQKLDVLGVSRTYTLHIMAPSTQRSFAQLFNSCNSGVFSVIGSATGTGDWTNGVTIYDTVIANYASNAGVMIGSAYRTGFDQIGLYVNESNNVGIGTNTPSTKLAVHGEISSSNANSYRHVYGNFGTFWRNDGNALYLMHTPINSQYGNWNTVNGGIVFAIQVEFATDNVNLASHAVHITDNNATLKSGHVYLSGGNAARAGNNLLELAADDAAKPSSTTWKVTSDARIKENIVLADLDVCYSNMKKIPLKYFKWRDDIYTVNQVKDRHKLGWIAQDVESVLPKAVQQQQSHGLGDCRTLDADQVYAIMYGTIQKLQLICESYEAKFTAQDATIADLTTRLAAVEAKP